MKRLIYIAGQPGAGKSTLAARLTEPYQRIPVQSEVNHDMLRDENTGHVIGAELGERRGQYAGVDLLPASIIDAAVPWIGSITDYDVILAEGQRLANKRFLYAALDAGYGVTLALLDHGQADTWRRERARKLGRVQNEAWVKGRLHAARTLADLFEKIAETERAQVLRGHPDDLFEPLNNVFLQHGSG